MSETINPIGNWSKRTVWSLIGSLVILGVVLLALNGPFSEIRSLRLVTFVGQTLPLVIAILAYSHIHSTATIWELIAVTVWGYIAINIAGIFGYFAFAGLSSTFPGLAQEMMQNIVRFLLATAVIGGLYATAAAFRERPWLAGLLLLLVPFGQFLVYGLV